MKFQHLDIWRYPSNVDRSFDIRLSPSEYTSLTSILDTSKYSWTVLIDDLQPLVNREREDREQQTRDGGFDYSKYHTLPEVKLILVTCLWCLISAARYEIAIVIILENFHENSKFPGNFI